MATSAWWATKTSRSIAGAAPTSRISWISNTITLTPRPFGWSRTTARRRTFWRRRAGGAGGGGGLTAGAAAETEALSLAAATEKYRAPTPADHVAILYRTNSQ